MQQNRIIPKTVIEPKTMDVPVFHVSAFGFALPFVAEIARTISP